MVVIAPATTKGTLGLRTRMTPNGDAPGATGRDGNGVEEHADSMSSNDKPAGMNGSATVPVAVGMTSEQSVRALCEKPRSESFSIVCSNF